MKYFFRFLFLVIILFLPFTALAVSPTPSYDNPYCDFSGGGVNGQPTGNVTITRPCVVYEDVTGVTGGNLVIDGGVVTLHKVLGFSKTGNVEVKNDGIIYVNTNGSIVQGTMCVKDADQDLYADTTTITSDPYGIALISPITQIQQQVVSEDTCPTGWTERTAIANLTLADTDFTSSGLDKTATSDRELLRLGFTIDGVKDALAAAGDIQIIDRNLLICTGGLCPATGFGTLTPTTGNVYVAGKIGVGATTPQATLDVRGNLYLNNGSAGAPAISFNSDTNTGIYRQGNDLLSIVANGQNAFNIDGTSGTGRLMIGNGTPTSRLQINDDNNSTASGITLGGNSSTNVQLYKSGSNQLAITGGNVGVGITNPSYKLTVFGTIYASGSSREYKEKIKPLEIDSNKIYGLNPVSYDYKKKYQNLGYDLAGGRQFGLIAEDVYPLIPELVISLRDKKISNVDYSKLSVLLLDQVQKQKKEIISLQQQISILQNEVEVIKRSLNQ